MPRFATVASLGFPDEPNPVSLLEIYRLLGCTHAQLYRSREHPLSTQSILRTVADAGLTLDSIHGVFGEDIDPSSPDPHQRQHALRVYADEARFALDLNAPLIVVHPATINPGKATLTPDAARASNAARATHLADFARRLADLGASLNATFLLENLPYLCPAGHDPAQLAELVLSIRSPFLRMCFDTGHAHITSDAPAALTAAAPAISYLHIHDNDAVQDDHRPIGRGTLDWAAFSKALVAANLSAPRMLELFLTAEQARSLLDPEVGPVWWNLLAL